MSSKRTTQYCQLKYEERVIVLNDKILEILLIFLFLVFLPKNSVLELITFIAKCQMIHAIFI